LLTRWSGVRMLFILVTGSVLGPIESACVLTDNGTEKRVVHQGFWRVLLYGQGRASGKKKPLSLLGGWRPNL
ncbi:hypothetical protein F5X99DRAFT_385749, partial [Biscogniauxia marginata]